MTFPKILPRAGFGNSSETYVIEYTIDAGGGILRRDLQQHLPQCGDCLWPWTGTLTEAEALIAERGMDARPVPYSARSY